jgi:protoporphyrinogen oxidase
MGVNLKKSEREVVILGGGLTGLSAGYVLSRSGVDVKVFERDAVVGGLSRTIVRGDFRFDLGGHRFFTKDKRIDNFVRELMKDELISVPRRSKILMRNKCFDYPIKPVNAMFGFGLFTTIKIVFDYGIERLKTYVRKPVNISLEDWVVNNFGRTMFDIYFKEYSEKVWGLECDRISVDWVAQRIRGLSLFKAIKNAFFKFNGRDIPSLVDRFSYPQLGIGRISDRLSEEINKNSAVYTEAKIERINHSNFRVNSIVVRDNAGLITHRGSDFISSIPLTNLLRNFDPFPPKEVLEAVSKLKFRDLVVVAVIINKERVTDQTWIYIPEKKIPFGRIHEPTNWSEKMAPEGKTLLVIEYFSFVGDSIWNESDKNLTALTVDNLEKMGFIKKHDVIDALVVRVPKAYPLFEVGYKEFCEVIYDYLDNFENLRIAGRSGMFRYYNMDHAIESGIDVAEKIIFKNPLSAKEKEKELALVTGNEGCDVH